MTARFWGLVLLWAAVLACGPARSTPSGEVLVEVLVVQAYYLDGYFGGAKLLQMRTPFRRVVEFCTAIDCKALALSREFSPACEPVEVTWNPLGRLEVRAYPEQGDMRVLADVLKSDGSTETVDTTLSDGDTVLLRRLGPRPEWGEVAAFVSVSNSGR